jgi:hypothetical protein
VSTPGASLETPAPGPALKRPATWLAQFRSDVFSQAGEDGVIQKILEHIPESDHWCVEFGAWDGQHLSNTCNLIDHCGYSAVLIEGDARKAIELRARFAKNSKVILLSRFVGFTEEDNLDHILGETPIPRDFDFLSIDIDGNDYHVWKAVSRYRPKVVCIEFNPTIPTEVDFVQAPDPRIKQGASLLSLVKLGAAKGYELVCVLPFNVFFVRAEYYQRFAIEDNRPEVLRTDLFAITHIFSGYDGTVLLAGNQTLPWHGVKLRHSRMQGSPRFLRRYPLDYGVLQRAAFRVFKAFSDPRSAARNLLSWAKQAW